jgi:uncharacterized surface protein with fasciclin (FAS1) repeats
MKQLFLTVFFGFLLLAGVASAQDEEFANPEATATLMAELRSMPEFSTFVRLLDRTNLVSNLDDGSMFTVFAPTNEALADQLDALDFMDDESPELTRFVRSFIVDEQFMASELLDRTTVTDLNGTELDVTIEDTATGETAEADEMDTDLSIDGIELDSAPIIALNGIIYPIDEVFPSSLEGF